MNIQPDQLSLVPFPSHLRSLWGDTVETDATPCSARSVASVQRNFPFISEKKGVWGISSLLVSVIHKVIFCLNSFAS